MGRNAGSQIMATHAFKVGTNQHVTTWYCQQHAKYDNIINTSLLASTATLKTHIETDHGNSEQ